MLNKLIKYTLKQGIALEYTNASFVHWKEGLQPNIPSRITLEDSGNEEHMMWDLLHELGHVELRKDWKVYKMMYPASALADEKWLRQGEKKYRRRNGYKVDTVREEVDAWQRGLLIAHRLRIDVDVPAYWEYANKALATYVRHYGAKLTR